LAGYAGDLDVKQKELLSRASARCDQAMESIRRMLAIAGSLEGAAGQKPTADIASVVRQTALRYEEESRRAEVEFTTQIPDSEIRVHGQEPALVEALSALLHNSLKYTPPHGRVRLELDVIETSRRARVRVADSGVGVPESDRERIFEPFFRTPGARASARPGTGLGLAFVRTVARSAGGSVHATESDLGGAEMVFELPLAQEQTELREGDTRVRNPLRVVIVGGVTAGPKVAAKVIRLVPDAHVTVVERGAFLSYAGCGLPYYVSGVVKEQRELMETPLGSVRDPVFFQNVKNVRVLSQTEATEIDRQNHRLRVQDVVSEKASWLEFDKLVLATGASPVVPSIPGIELDNIFTLHGVHDAEGIRAALAEGKAHDVVIVGAGLLGVEATEALVRKGCRVTIVEMLPQALRILDWHMARLVTQHMEANGVRVLLGTRVDAFEGDKHVAGVVTDQGTLPADVVILGIGVRPNVQLAREAGLEMGPTGAIRVDERMGTSDPDIYAAGDCVESTDLLTERPCYVPLGSTANKQARVAAVNVCGGDDRFPGVLGSTVCKVFDYCVARTGLTETQALEAGFDVVSALAPAPDRAHFMPNARMLMLKIVVEATTRRLLGAQAVGPGAGDKRIDVAAMAITAGMTVDQLANADLCYAPPYAPAMDNIITAANVARNKLDGHMVGVSPQEVHQMMEDGKEFLFLDCRSPSEHDRVRLPGATLIPLGSLRGRLGELPRDREIITFGEISLRGYEAALILRAAGFENVRVMDGGVVMWPFQKIT
jgi:NADPH-dependent 2,4-dienoyl-CoA reductase/sulfur reductase-like enzyme/rhodanese-related sulfurtransferase